MEKSINHQQSIIHYGTMGMHWGRHKKADPIQVVRAKKTVEETKITLKKARREMNYETGYGTILPSQAVQKKFNSAQNEYKYATQDLTNIKVLNKLQHKPKSKTQLALEDRYKKRGFSDDEAAVAAYQNIRTKKIIAAVAGTAIVVGGGYAAYKIHDARIDKIIKAGTTIQNISSDDNPGIRDAFYAANNKMDKVKYRGMYGQQLMTNSTDKKVIQKEIKALSDIKQASFKNAKNSLEDLLKSDTEFSEDLKKYLGSPSIQMKFGEGSAGRMGTAAKSLANGKIDKNVYEAFNIALVDHDPAMQKMTDKYFGELTKRGYNAIRDVNDSKYSGYKSLNPIIAFGTTGKIEVVDIKKLTEQEVIKAKDIAFAQIAVSTFVPQGAAVAATLIANNKLTKVINDAPTKRKVNAYIRDNPNTKMTITEISRMIERSAF